MKIKLGYDDRKSIKDIAALTFFGVIAITFMIKAPLSMVAGIAGGCIVVALVMLWIAGATFWLQDWRGKGK
jgi:hypothetical protein